MKYTIPLRSEETTQGRLRIGARSLWRANGMKDENFGKPIIAIVNSFTQFVPGHAHLHHLGQEVKKIIEKKGYFSAEFNTIAIDDGIAMGHDGMFYSLPSRDLIADSIEYMCNAHKVDALICISNCDKITPGMLMAVMRLNLPAIFVSGGPMEAGLVENKKVDLVDAIIIGGNKKIPDELLSKYEQNACPTCGSCAGMFTANSMNCLVEALGLALPGNGSILATHKNRLNHFEKSALRIVEITEDYYIKGNKNVLPRAITSYDALMNAMTLDIAMGGSTNTVLHLLAIAKEAKVNFTLKDIDNLSRKTPNLCKIAPSSSYHMEDFNRAGGVYGVMAELNKINLINTDTYNIIGNNWYNILKKYDITNEKCDDEAINIYKSAPGRLGRNLKFASQDKQFETLDKDRVKGCIRNYNNAYSEDGGLAVLYGNIAPDGCIVKTSGVDSSILKFQGKAKVYHSQEEACEAILSGKVISGDVVFIIYEGPKGGPGMQEMLYPTSYLKSKNLDKTCALITDGRFSGGTSGLSIGHISPEAAAKGNIALVQNGDKIEINIPKREINVLISDNELHERKINEMSKSTNAYQPERQKRYISKALKAYAALVSSADEGAIRKI